MLDHDTFVAQLRQAIAEGRITNAAIGRIIKQPSSRVSEMLNGRRRVQVDEMKALVEELGIDETPPAPTPETLEPILDAILPLAPPGPMTDQSRRALAVALSYGLELLGSPSSSSTTDDALRVAARAAAARFRETATAS